MCTRPRPPSRPPPFFLTQVLFYFFFHRGKPRCPSLPLLAPLSIRLTSYSQLSLPLWPFAKSRSAFVERSFCFFGSTFPYVPFFPFYPHPSMLPCPPLVYGALPFDAFLPSPPFSPSFLSISGHHLLPRLSTDGKLSFLVFRLHHMTFPPFAIAADFHDVFSLYLFPRYLSSPGPVSCPGLCFLLSCQGNFPDGPSSVQTRSFFATGNWTVLGLSPHFPPSFKHPPSFFF